MVDARFVVLGAALAAAGGSPAATFIDTFEGGTNAGRWQFYDLGPTQLAEEGGNPGWQLRLALCCDAAVPWVQTIGESVFTGDYRARGVTQLATDVRVYSVEIGGYIDITHLSLRLETDAGTPGNPSDDFAAYFAGDKEHALPEEPEEWRTIEFDVDARSETPPEGWILLPISRFDAGVIDPPTGARWRTLMEHVTAVSFEYGPEFWVWPLLYFDFGVDNPTIVAGPSADLDGDGDVDFGDLLALLAAWGDCPPVGACPADLDASGAVGFGDLLVLLASWS